MKADCGNHLVTSVICAGYKSAGCQDAWEFLTSGADAIQIPEKSSRAGEIDELEQMAKDKINDICSNEYFGTPQGLAACKAVCNPHVCCWDETNICYMKVCCHYATSSSIFTSFSVSSPALTHTINLAHPFSSLQ